MNNVSMYITKLISLMKDRRQGNAENIPMDKMVQYIGIAGVREPEKMAEGPCPHCKNKIELWLTSQGIELSIAENSMKLNAIQTLPVDQKIT